MKTTAARLDVHRMENWEGVIICEARHCVNRAIWRIKFHGERCRFLAGDLEPDTLLSCDLCADSLVHDFQAVGDLVVFWNQRNWD